MKKSKIIVPALAMIGLSAVASVTGSVAWFTAQRTGSITTGDFVVTKVSGALGVAVTEGAGTTTQNASPKSIIAKSWTVEANTVNANLRDASFNPANKTLYTARDNGASFSEVSTTGYNNITESGHPFIFNNADHIYHAFTWKVTLSVDGSSSSSMNVFFDYANSSMTATDVSGTSENQSSKGFRIAMICGSKVIVYAKLQGAANLETVNGNPLAEAAYTSLSGFSYFASDLYGAAGTAVGSLTDVDDFAANKAQDADANQSNRPDYLGNVTSSTDLDVYCVAWYDGCDSNVINDTKMQKVASTLAFYSTVVSD